MTIAPHEFLRIRIISLLPQYHKLFETFQDGILHGILIIFTTLALIVRILCPKQFLRVLDILHRTITTSILIHPTTMIGSIINSQPQKMGPILGFQQTNSTSFSLQTTRIIYIIRRIRLEALLVTGLTFVISKLEISFL